ncbi:hypothetical protein D3C81_1708950 [compost metagenome]
MLHHFADHTAIAATYDKHVLRIRMGKQRRVCHHLMINKLVLDRGHYHAVEHEHPPELLGIDHRKVLKIRLFRH